MFPVVSVAEHDPVFIGLEDIPVTDRTALDVASQVGHHSMTVEVALPDVYIPFDSVTQPIEQFMEPIFI